MKQSYLRLLTFILPISEIYDILWLVKKSGEYWNDTSEGGMSQVVLMTVFMLVFYKIMLFFVMWKASLNFKKFVQ